jgi:hypothetical protein
MFPVIFMAHMYFGYHITNETTLYRNSKTTVLILQLRSYQNASAFLIIYKFKVTGSCLITVTEYIRYSMVFTLMSLILIKLCILRYFCL